jgi:perosamine synthetase
MIRLTKPSITDKEIKAVTKAVKNCWGKNAYNYIRKFEQKMCQYTGRKYAVSTSSGAGALHLALLALDIGKGDEVIIPDITYVATAFAVSHTGATPVFCDINETWCINPLKIEKLITKRTKAIIPVDLYGHPVDMESILKIAKKHDLYVIDDSCEALGSTYSGKKVGSEGDISIFSFHGTKILTTGEGGMLLTDDERIYNRVKFLNNNTDRDHKYLCDEVSWKYDFTDIQAALGIAQLSRLKEIVAKKRQIRDWYSKHIVVNPQKQGCKSNFWFITYISDHPKEYMVRRLKAKGIDCRPVFYPMSMQKPYQKADNPMAYWFTTRGINLPCGSDLTEKQVNYICKIIKEIE